MPAPDNTEGFIIDLYAITVCLLYKTCLKKLGIDDDHIRLKFRPRMLREAMEREMGVDLSDPTTNRSRDTYIRDRYREVCELLETGKPQQVVSYNYTQFSRLIKFAGAESSYQAINDTFKPDRLPQLFNILDVDGKPGRISFHVDVVRSAPPRIKEAPCTPPIAAKPVVPVVRYNLPIRPPFFIGRADKLLQIHQKLTDTSQRQNVLLLNGIGGMGKTTLMQEYLYQDNCQQHFERIIFASINKDLEAAFISAASLALGLEEKRKQLTGTQQQLELVTGEMKSINGNNLFILDNVNESDFEELRRHKQIFNTTGWKFLITTRTVPDGFAFLDVDELEITAARLLFAYHFTGENYGSLSPEEISEELKSYIKTAYIGKDLDELLNHIVRHTLLTELLAKAGNKKGLSITRLLSALKDEDFRHPDLQRLIETGDHATSTFRQQLNTSTLHNYLLNLFETAYLVAITGDGRVDLENEAKATMLRFFSLLPAIDMPIADLRVLWMVEKQEENTFEDRLDELRQIGWIQGKREARRKVDSQNLAFKMHPLVQEVVYEKLTPNIDNCLPLVISVTDILGHPLSYPQPFQNYAQSIADNLEGLDMSADEEND